MLRGFSLDPPQQGGLTLADLPYVSVPAAGTPAATAAWRLVVPASVLRIPYGIGSVQVRFAFHLYHRQGEVDVSVPREALRALKVGSHAYLVLTLSRGQLHCEYNPEAAGRAIESALATAADDMLPVAQLAGETPAAAPAEADITYTLTDDEVNEATILTGTGRLTSVSSGGTPQAAPSFRRGVYGWVAFGVLTVVLFLLLNRSGNKRAPVTQNAATTPVVSPWRSSASIVGGAMALAGAAATIIAVRHLPRQKGESACVQAGEAAFLSANAECQTTYEWAYFDRLVETPNLFVLLAGMECQVIPKRALAAGQLERLQHLLRRRIAVTGCFT